MFTAWAVALTSVSHSSKHGAELLTSTSFAISAIVDSGSPNMYLPSALASSIAALMNSTTVQGFPYVPCSLKKAPEIISFGFGGAGGPSISVPYSALIYPYGVPSNIGEINAPDGNPLCYLGVIGTGGNIYLLGDTFMRSAYLVYDVDNQQIAMAPASFNIHAEHIVEIPAGTALPGVRTTNSYLLPTATASA